MVADQKQAAPACSSCSTQDTRGCQEDIIRRAENTKHASLYICKYGLWLNNNTFKQRQQLASCMKYHGRADGVEVGENTMFLPIKEERCLCHPSRPALLPTCICHEAEEARRRNNMPNQYYYIFNTRYVASRIFIVRAPRFGDNYRRGVMYYRLQKNVYRSIILIVIPGTSVRVFLAHQMGRDCQLYPFCQRETSRAVQSICSTYNSSPRQVSFSKRASLPHQRPQKYPLHFSIAGSSSFTGSMPACEYYYTTVLPRKKGGPSCHHGGSLSQSVEPLKNACPPTAIYCCTIICTLEV